MAKTHIALRLGVMGRGKIDPNTRIALGETSDHEIEAFTEALKGNHFYDEIGTDRFMLRCCVDGRHRLDGACYPAANAAGGVFTLLAADMLTTQRFRVHAKTTRQYAAHLFSHLDEAGYTGQYGDHCSDLPYGEGASGCGAVDQMILAVAFIAANGDMLRHFAEENLGVSINDDDHELIVATARKLANGADLTFESGKDLIAELKRDAGEQSVEVLTGQHKEVAVVVNEVEGTTLNRAKVVAAYRDRVQAFNYDRWAVKKAVQTISQNVEIDEERKKLLAADYFNLAVTCLLAGPGLRIVPRVQMALVAV